MKFAREEDPNSLIREIQLRSLGRFNFARKEDSYSLVRKIRVPLLGRFTFAPQENFKFHIKENSNSLVRKIQIRSPGKFQIPSLGNSKSLVRKMILDRAVLDSRCLSPWFLTLCARCLFNPPEATWRGSGHRRAGGVATGLAVSAIVVGREW